MKKKNIDKLFREKLQDYSQLPEEHVWDRISGSLDEKKAKRRIIPIWWRLGGVAAILIAGFFLFTPEEQMSSSPEGITDTESGAEEPIRSGSDVIFSEPDEKQDGIAVTEEAADNSPQEEEPVGKTKSQTEEHRISIEESDASATRGSAKTEEIARAEKKEKNVQIKPTPSADSEEDGVLTEIARNITEKSGRAMSTTTEKNAGEIARNNPEGQDEVSNPLESPEEKAKASLLEVIAKQDEETEEKESADRWEVGPRVAPVFFSSLSQGSPIHSSFRDNAKAGNVNMSYGVAVTYEIGKKVKLRSGVHRVDFGYDTKDVSFSSSLNANTTSNIDNINYSLSSRNLVVRSNTPSGKAAPSESAQDVAGPDASLNGIMVQEFGYLEVPLELSYEVINRKLGLNIVGGVSSLFLLDNSVVLQANGNTTEMGEANNINDLNFSTNFGVGLTYRLNDKVQVNLEPMFKYQLNTFSDTSGNFQPFSMGVYSGLNFRF